MYQPKSSKLEHLNPFSVILNFMVGIFFGLLLTGNPGTYAKAAGLISPIISTVLGGSLD